MDFGAEEIGVLIVLGIGWGYFLGIDDGFFIAVGSCLFSLGIAIYKYIKNPIYKCQHCSQIIFVSQFR